MMAPRTMLLPACGLIVLVLTHGTSAQVPETVQPSLLPWPEIQTNYPTTGYPEIGTPPGRFDGQHPGEPAGGPARAAAPLEPMAGPSGPAPGPNPWQQGFAYLNQYPGKGNPCCGPHAPCLQCEPRWYAGLAGLWISRDHQNDVWLSFDTSDVGSALLGTPDATMGTAWGVEARVGKVLSPYWAVEGIYWTAFPDVEEANAFDPDGSQGSGADLNTTLAFQALDYPAPGSPIVQLFDDAVRHRLLRSFGMHNLELHLVRRCLTPCDPHGRHPRLGWLMGIRYLRLDEGMTFSADTVDDEFTGDPEEVHYLIDVVNHLVGFQVGGAMDLPITQCLSTYAVAKTGIYGVHIRHHSCIGGSAGTAVVNDPASPYNGQFFAIQSSKDDVAMVGELDVGLAWQLHPHWTVRAGYRAVGVTGLALATNQVPMNFGDLGGVADIDSNGHIILHGGYLAVEWLH